MARARTRSSQKGDARTLGVIVLVVLVLGLVGAIGNAVGRHPVAGSFALLCAGVLAVALGWGRHRRRRGIRWQARTLGDLLTLSPTAFEHAVADLLRALGYRDVRRVGGSGDQGVDVACRDAAGKRVIVQCKRYGPATKVGSPDLQ